MNHESQAPFSTVASTFVQLKMDSNPSLLILSLSSTSSHLGVQGGQRKTSTARETLQVVACEACRVCPGVLHYWILRFTFLSIHHHPAALCSSDNMLKDLGFRRCVTRGECWRWRCNTGLQARGSLLTTKHGTARPAARKQEKQAHLVYLNGWALFRCRKMQPHM